MEELTESTCKNCGESLSNAYCPNCGQKVLHDRITIRTSLSQFWASVFNVEKGLWFTLKMMMINPKKVFDDYLSGNRLKYMHPFRFAIILLTIQTFLMLSTGLYEDIQQSVSQASGQKVNALQQGVTEFINMHMNLIIAFSIPFLALGTKLLFRSAKYNYAEHLVMQSFAYGQVVAIGIVTLPLQFFLKDLPIGFRLISGLLSIGYLTYVYISTFQQRPVLVLLKTIVVFFFWFIGMMIISMIVGGVYIFVRYQQDPTLFSH